MKEYDLWIFFSGLLIRITTKTKRTGELRGKPYSLPAQRRIIFMSKGWWDYNPNALMREHTDGRFVALSAYLKTLAERDSNCYHPSFPRIFPLSSGCWESRRIERFLSTQYCTPNLSRAPEPQRWAHCHVRSLCAGAKVTRVIFDRLGVGRQTFAMFFTA